MPREPRLRRAVRVVLVDPDERVLTVRWRLPDGRGVWGFPGGGIEPGESREAAVRRELHEEVDLELPAERVGPCVAHLVHVHPIGEPYDGQEEWYYLLLVPAFEPRGALDDEALAAEGIVEIRWQSIAELRAIPAVGPVALRADTADFTERLVRGGDPERPEELAF